MSDAFRLAIQLLKARRVPLAVLFFAGITVTLNLEPYLFDKDPHQETLRIFAHLCAGLWDLFEGVLVLLILSWATVEVHPLKGERFLKQPFSRAYLGPLIAEYLRVLANILFFGLLLFIPGFVRYIQLLFVPLIVLFSRNYENDEIDALQLSRQLVKPQFYSLMSFMLLMILLQMALELLPHASETLHSLPVRLVFFALGLLLSVFSYSFLFLRFEKALATADLKPEA